MRLSKGSANCKHVYDSSGVVTQLLRILFILTYLDCTPKKPAICIATILSCSGSSANLA